MSELLCFEVTGVTINSKVFTTTVLATHRTQAIKSFLKIAKKMGMTDFPTINTVRK